MDERQELEAVLDATWNQLISLWTNYGHTEESIRKRKQTVVKHAKVLFDEMVTEEERKSAEKRESNRLAVCEVIQLSSDLGIEPTVEPYSENSNNTKSLLVQEAELSEIVENLRAQKKIRMAKYDYLREQEKVLCDELFESPAVIQFTGIPHDDQVAELEGVVRHWNEEKICRINAIEELKTSILPLFNLLEKLPGNAVERMIVGTTMPALSSKNIHDFQNLLSSLQSQVRINEAEAESLWVRINELWKRLKTSEEHIESFKKSKTGCKPSVLKELGVELGRCEEEKRQNIQSFIIELRHELRDLWKMCYLSDEQKLDFPEFDSNEFTEESLTAHEEQAAKWKSYYAKNQKMIETVKRQGETWLKWLDLEAIEDDPGRLSNRGGALLKHEKEKKGTKKILDKYESDIRKLNTAFQAEYGTSFQVYGRPILEAIEQEKLRAAEERQERKNFRKRQVEEAKGTPGAGSRKRPLPQTPGGKGGGYTPMQKRGKQAPGCTSTFISRPSPNPSARFRLQNTKTKDAERIRRHLRKSRMWAIADLLNRSNSTSSDTSSITQPTSFQPATIARGTVRKKPWK